MDSAIVYTRTKPLGLRKRIGGTEASARAAQISKEIAEKNRANRASFSLEKVEAFIAARPYLKLLGTLDNNEE